MKIGHHPEDKTKQLFTVSSSRMKQYMTIPDSSTRYWFTLEDWLEKMDTENCYTSWPSDGSCF